MTPEQIRIFQAMPPARRLGLAAEFYFASRALKAQALRAQHPGWSKEEIDKRVKELFLYAGN